MAVDPLNPLKVISAWVNNDTADIPAPGPQVFVEGRFRRRRSTWTPFQDSVVLLDPNTTNPTVPYLQITNPSVGFDRSGNFYVLLDEHNAGGTSGAIVVQKFAFTGMPPSPSGISNRSVDQPRLTSSTNGCQWMTRHSTQRWRWTITSQVLQIPRLVKFRRISVRGTSTLPGRRERLPCNKSVGAVL